MPNRFSPQWSEAGQRNVTAVVKWYNPTKGFGFVQPTDGSADAFLHASVLARAGQQSLPEGATIVCDIGDGQRGPQVTALHAVQEGAPASARPAAIGGPIEGPVKFFNASKGFGFIAPDDGGRDVFVSARTLERTGLSSLESDQRVRLTIRVGQKGPMADSVEPI